MYNTNLSLLSDAVGDTQHAQLGLEAVIKMYGPGVWVQL